MASVTSDRRNGLNASAAVKVPCRVATTANITLSGEQTIDGVACVADDRVLVKNQTTGADNGIYVVSTSAWTRAPDWDGAYDVRKGTLIRVNEGTLSGFWYVSTSDPITIGSTSVTIAQASSTLAVISAFAQTLLDDASAGDALTTLGVTAFAQTILDDANAAAARTTLGVPADADVVHLTGNETAAGIKTLSSGLGAQYIQNCSMSASVAAKALTFALKGNNGSDPSASNVVSLAFRSTTATSGVYVIRQITSAASIVVPSTATLGFSANETGYVYVYLCDDGSSREIGVTKNAIFDESTLHATTAVSTSSDSSTVLYTTSSLSGAAVRLIGRITVQSGAVAGEWDNAPTRLEMWTPSMKKTGDVVQTVNTTDGSVSTTTTVMPYDDTIPQVTEGGQMLGLAITPRSAINQIDIEAIVYLATSAADGVVTAAIFQDSNANALAAASEAVTATNSHSAVPIRHLMTAGTTSSTNLTVRAGPTSGTLTLNGDSGARKLGGVFASYLRLTEIQA